ncbi:MAG: rod shape-determining protein MreD, partial [Solirubrobacterales bacterium]|nr:rod shape-determining protein MreD [Solirubrobacterales bacterium]
MIVTRPIALRIALLVLATVILQVSFFSYLSFLGTTPNVIGVVVVSLGLLGGAVTGAVCGFAAGLLLDALLLQTLGVSSIVLLSIGYLAGRYREGFEITSSLVPPLLAGGFTFVGAAGFAAIQLMLGVEAPVSLLVLREILVQGLLAVLFAIPIYPLVRRILAPALIDYAPARRLLTAGLRRPRVRAGVQRPAGAVPYEQHQRAPGRCPACFPGRPRWVASGDVGIAV